MGWGWRRALPAPHLFILISSSSSSSLHPHILISSSHPHLLVFSSWRHSPVEDRLKGTGRTNPKRRDVCYQRPLQLTHSSWSFYTEFFHSAPAAFPGGWAEVSAPGAGQFSARGMFFPWHGRHHQRFSPEFGLCFPAHSLAARPREPSSHGKHPKPPTPLLPLLHHLFSSGK